MEQETNQEVQQDVGTGVKDILIQFAKSFNGYKCISASRIERIPEKSSEYSTLLKQIQYVYLTRSMNEMILKNPGKKYTPEESEAIQKQIDKDFMEVFGNGRLVFIQAHMDRPTLAKDGLYNSVDLEGKYIKSKIINQFTFATDEDAKNFKPTIIEREHGPDGKPVFNVLEGSPFHEITPAEAAAVIAMTQPDAVEQKKEN